MIHVGDTIDLINYRAAMPAFYILTDNSSYQTKTEVSEVSNPEEALALGVRGAIFMAHEDISRGEAAAAVEVAVEDGIGAELLRSVVAVSVSRLVVREEKGST